MAHQTGKKEEWCANLALLLSAPVWYQAWPGAGVGATISGVAQDAKPLEPPFLVDSFNQPSLSAKSWGNDFSGV